MSRSRWGEQRPRKFTWFGFFTFVAALLIIGSDILRDLFGRSH